jgi:hypothetical protein
MNGDLHAGQADTIQFDRAGVTGPIVLGGTQLTLTIPGSTAAVTIDGGNGVTVSGNNRSRVFEIDSGVQATLIHLTLAAATATPFTNGGVIWNRGATLTIRNTTLTQGSAGQGGGWRTMAAT